MNELIQKLKYNYKNGDVTVRIIFICTGVFLLNVLMNFVFFRNSGRQFEDFFGVISGLDGFLKQPWGVLSYLFFHGSILHLVLNMLMVYFIGQMFLRYFRPADFLTFFIFGSISGAAAFLIFSGLSNYSGLLIGASAAVYSIFFALVAYVPKTKVQLFLLNFNIPLDYIAYGLIAYDLFSIFSGNNTGGHVSHLGGAIFGFLYMKQFEKGNDFLGKLIRSFKSKPKISRTRPRYKTPPRDDYEFNGEKIKKQKEIDKILDKISRSGYESLTKEEKDILFNAGRNG